jgi:hypothetical protein
MRPARPTSSSNGVGLAWQAHDNLRGPPNREGQSVEWDAGFSRGAHHHLLCLRWRLSRRGLSGSLSNNDTFPLPRFRVFRPKTGQSSVDGHVSDDPRGMCGVQRRTMDDPSISTGF